MKNQFNGYYQITDTEFKKLWTNAIIIFDTNVLLNLYRYQSSTTESLLKMMEKLSKQVWIPYHVGLEFQRNRLNVIADQFSRFSDVRSIISKAIDQMQSDMQKLKLETRHSHIDPDKITKEIMAVKNSYFKELDELEKTSISLSSNDEIRTRLDTLFDKKIGAPPKEQSFIDKLCIEGESRYDKGVPPGFKDAHKDKEDDAFSYAGVAYKRKFGDLIIWRQIIEHVKAQNLKDVIFITDDNKSDWWLEVKGKTIGPRPELIEEIFREAGVEKFHMYTTEGFLEYSNKHFDAKINQDAIDEVREVQVARNSSLHERYYSIRHAAESAEQAVFEWLRGVFERLERVRGFPDFIGYQGDLKYGFEVKVIRDSRMIMHRMDEIVFRAYHSIKEDKFFEINIVLVVSDISEIPKLTEIVKKRAKPMGQNINFVIGSGEVSPEGQMRPFLPYEHIKLS